MQKIKPLLIWLQKPSHLTLLLLSLLPIFLVYIYIDAYGQNAPTNDQWLDSLDIAVATKDGSLTLKDITQVYYGHRAVFTNGFTAFLAYTTNWQVELELFLSFALAVGRFILVVLIFRALFPQLTYLVLLPFSLLIFSMYQYLIWLSGIYSVWHFVSFFSLAAVYTLTQFKVGWHPLISAAVLAACASFSQGSGVITFPVLAITLWMFGYRHWKYYAFWMIATAFTLFLYFGNSGVGVGGETSDTTANINLHDPVMLFKFVFAFLGNPFTYSLDAESPIYIGIIGVGLLVLNLWYLWQQQKNLKLIAPWMTLAGFASSIAVIVYMTRYREDRFIYAIEQRYAIVSTNLWLAVIATGIIVWWVAEHRKIRTQWENMLPAANVIVGVLLVVLYLLANMWNLQATALRYEYALGEKFPPHEECLLNFPLKRDFSCIENSVPLGEASEDDVYRLAYYELGIFNNQQTTINVLPENYQAGSPIILDSPSRWMNAYLRKWYLQAVDESVIFHVAPEATEISTDTLQEPLAPVVTGYGETTTELLKDFIGDAKTVWYIRTRETQPNEPAAFETLTNLGYLPTVIPSPDYRYNSEIFVVRYERAPETLDEIHLFADTISLQNVTIATDHFEPCQEITVQTWWLTENPLEVQYGLRLSLANNAEQVLEESAGGLTPVPTVFWSPHQLYLDERYLTLPCELPEGIYTLQVRVENSQTGESESVMIAEFEILE